MPNISRRIFLRNASIGAAATGVAAAGGLNLLTGVAGAAAATPPKTVTPDAPVLEGSGVVAHVVDAKSGQISLFVGTKHINYTNQALAQELLKATK
jgi:cell division ATPase FtsA